MLDKHTSVHNVTVCVDFFEKYTFRPLWGYRSLKRYQRKTASCLLSLREACWHSSTGFIASVISSYESGVSSVGLVWNLQLLHARMSEFKTVSCTLRAACCNFQLHLCKIEKFDFLKLCHDKGLC